MDRRAFLGALGLLAGPIPVAAQQAGRVPRIGMLLSSLTANAHLRAAFLQELRDLGYVEGRSVEIEYRSAEAKVEQFPTLAAELVALKVDVIVTPGTPAAVAAKQATRAVAASSITLQGDGFQAFGGPTNFTIGDLDSTLGDITGVALSVTNITGLTLADITFTAHSVTVVVETTEWGREGPASALITLCFADSDAACAAASVPVPATLLLLASAATGLGAVRARRRR